MGTEPTLWAVRSTGWLDAGRGKAPQGHPVFPWFWTSPMLPPIQSKPYFAWSQDVVRRLYIVAQECKALPHLEGYLGLPLAMLVPHTDLRP